MQRQQPPSQVLFRVQGSLQQPSGRQTANRGRYGQSNYRRGGPGGAEFRIVSGGGGLGNSPRGPKNRPRGPGTFGGRGDTGGGGRGPAPATVIRNPKFPKSLYDVEMSMRQVYKNKPIKLTQGMSFPDPKSPRSMSNPQAPRFEYEFEPSRDDYNFIHNRMAGAEDGSELTARDPVRERYIDAVAYCSDSDTDSDDQDRDNIGDYDSDVSDAAAGDDERDGDLGSGVQQPQVVEEQLYAHTRPKAHRVREAQLMKAQPPVFEPQPPPPRAPVDPVLVIPRAMVREEELLREQRYGNRNGTASPPDNNHNGTD